MQNITSLKIIFIVSSGILTFVILFIFAKRQITRFALRSRRGPHVTIGTDAKKTLKREIERCIEAVPRIMHEPRLINLEPSHYILEPQQPYHYRFKAVDDVKILEEEIARQEPGLRRHARESLRAFLLTSLAAALDGRDQKLVHQFCDAYEFARHHPAEFGQDEYQAYSRLLMKLLDAARLLKSVGGCRGVGMGWTPRESPSAGGGKGRDEGLRLRPAALPAVTKLHRHYTALKNMPGESKLEEEIIRIPVPAPTPVPAPPPAPASGRSSTAVGTAPTTAPPDETSV